MSTSLSGLGGPPLGRRSLMTAVDDVDNSFDNSNSFDISNPDDLKQKINIEDQASFGDDMDFLLNGGFEELNSTKDKKSSKSKSKSKKSSSKKSSRSRSKDKKETTSSFDISSPLNTSDAQSSPSRFDHDFDEPSSSPNNIPPVINDVEASIGSEDSFGIPKSGGNKRRVSRKIFATSDKTESQMGEALDIDGAGGRVGGPVDTTPEKETISSPKHNISIQKQQLENLNNIEEVTSIRSPTRKDEMNKVSSFDDFDDENTNFSSMMGSSSNKQINDKNHSTDKEDEEDDDFEFDEIPMMDLDDDFNKKKNEKTTKNEEIENHNSFKSPISPKNNNQGNLNNFNDFDYNKSTSSVATPRGQKQSPSFDFGIGEKDDKDDKDEGGGGGDGGGGEFDWMLPKRGTTRARRGEKIKEKSSPQADWLKDTARPKRVLDPFASKPVSNVTKPFSFVDSDDSDIEEEEERDKLISNSIWAAGKTKSFKENSGTTTNKVSTESSENNNKPIVETRSIENKINISNKLSSPILQDSKIKSLNENDGTNNDFSRPPEIITSLQENDKDKEEGGGDTPVVGSPGSFAEYSEDEFEVSSPHDMKPVNIDVPAKTSPVILNKELLNIEVETSSNKINSDHRGTGLSTMADPPSSLSSLTSLSGLNLEEIEVNTSLEKNNVKVSSPLEVTRVNTNHILETYNNSSSISPQQLQTVQETAVQHSVPISLPSSPNSLPYVTTSDHHPSPSPSIHQQQHTPTTRVEYVQQVAPQREEQHVSYIIKGEEEVGLDNINAIVKKSVEKAISTAKHQAMIDIARVRAECEVEVAEAKHKIEVAQEALRVEENKVKILQLRADAEKEGALNELAKELNTRHNDDLRRLKDVHLKELATKDKSAGGEAALRNLADEFHHSVGTLEIIKHQLEAGKHGAHVTREAELDARERRIAEEMLVLKTAEVTNEKKVAEVRALLHNLAEMQRSMRNDSYADKQRLSDESERLSRESECRERAAQARENSLLSERKELERNIAEFATKQRKMENEHNLKNKEIQSLYQELENKKLSFIELKKAALRELEDREVAIVTKEKELNECYKTIELSSIELDKNKNKIQKDIEEYTLLKKHVEASMLKVEEEKMKVRELGMMMEEASENIAKRAHESEMRLQEAMEIKAIAEDSENRSAEHRFRVDGVVVDLEKQRLAIEQDRCELINEQRMLREAKRQFEQEAKDLLLSDTRKPSFVDFQNLEQASQLRRLEVAQHGSHIQATTSTQWNQSSSSSSSPPSNVHHRTPLSNRSFNQTQYSTNDLKSVFRTGEFESLRQQGATTSKVIDTQAQFLRDIGALD